jgi:hypothetical protein
MALKNFARTLSALMIFFLFSANAKKSIDEEFCTAVRQKADSASIIGPSYDADDIWRTSEFDFDRDGLPDEMTLSCPQGHSFMPAEPCELTVKLSSGELFHRIPPRVSVHLFKGNSYLVISTPYISDGIRKALLQPLSVVDRKFQAICRPVTRIFGK